jgi:diacylglycerol kinase (ATP)
MAIPELTPKIAPNGLRRLLLAATYALRGLLAAWRREAAFRQELIIAAALLPVALSAAIAPLERIALIVALFAVLVIELLNTAIEAVVDLTSPARHPLAAVAKDAGAAAVLLSLLIAAGVWLTVFLPRG